jgi:transcription antitermination factor NusG
MSGEKWFALQVNSKREALISASLRMKGYEEFLPQYSDRRRSASRAREVSLPLFPGYVFCRLDLNQRILPVLTTPGVIGLVGVGKTPIPVEDAEVDAIKAAVEFGQIEPYPRLAVGQSVEMTNGPLAGCEGIVVKVRNSWRLVISVTLLQRSIAVEIDRDWARPVSSVALNRAPDYLQNNPLRATVV